MGDTDFEEWLSEKFRQLNTDEAVFVPYITSILEGEEESKEEKDEAIDGILAELAEIDSSLDVAAFRKEILSRWELKLKNIQESKLVTDGSGEGDVDTNKFAQLLKLNEDITSAASKHQGKNDKPDKDLRAAILNQYKDSSENESDGDEPAGSSSGGATRGGGGFSASGLERNTNAERVQSELKDKREQEKADAAKKREKDREDRAKQKQQAQDRKDKAKKKAAKVERKR